MHASRLVQELEKLNPRDQERFTQFVESPYFNQHANTRKLLRLIYNGLDNKEYKLERRRLHKQLFPGKPYREQAVFDVMSYLKKLFLRFLAYEQLADQEFGEELLTFEAAYHRRRFDLMKNRAKRLERDLGGTDKTGGHFRQLRYQLHKTLGYYEGTFETENRATIENLQRMIDELDGYYIIEKLKNACQLQAMMMRTSSEYDMGLLDELLKFLETNWDDKFAEQPSIGMYYNILMSLRRGDNPQYYKYLRELIDTKLELFDGEERSNLFHFANNYCILKINQGNGAYIDELFQLYRRADAANLLLENGMINEKQYKNITALGCRLREFDYVEDFLERYRESLPANKQENAYTFNKATFFYHQKRYDEAENLLRDVNFTDVIYHTTATMLRMRIFFENGDTESLINLLETFRLYILRNRKLSVQDKRSYNTFIRFARNVLPLKHQANTLSQSVYHTKLQKLHEKIRTTENMYNRDWLLAETRVESPKPA